MNLRQGSMTFKEYCLKFSQLVKYASDLISNTWGCMSKFIIGISGLVPKKYRTMMLNRDMDLARLMIYAQQIKVDKLRERERMRGSKRLRSDHHEFSWPKFYGGNHPQFQKRSSALVPSLASSPVLRGSSEQGGRPFMSGSQNSVTQLCHPPCAKYGRNHLGEYFGDARGCLSYGKEGHRLIDYAHARQGNRDARPPAQATSAPAHVPHSAPIQGTYSSNTSVQCQNRFYALPSHR